jgi:hypothetical protein
MGFDQNLFESLKITVIPEHLHARSRAVPDVIDQSTRRDASCSGHAEKR